MTKYAELATKYNTTTEEIRDAWVRWIETEGNPTGTSADDDFDTFGDYLDYKYSHKATITAEPFQKSDLGYGL